MSEERAGELTSRAEPTAQLRWVKRIVRPTEDKEKLMTFLQQAWSVIEYRDRVRSDARIEWRDVPVQSEE